MEILLKVLKESFTIAFLVLLMMTVVDLINVSTKGKLESLIKKGNKFRQYFAASLLGITPGCLGSFAGVSLYIHGIISFGALTGLMLATAGDEQFVMIVMIPDTAFLIFGILFLLGLLTGYITDYIVKKFNIKTSPDCKFQQYHPGEGNYKHYFTDHIWNHIIKVHLARIFLWTFGTLLVIEYGMSLVNLTDITSEYAILWLLLAASIGLIPESGPHLIFVMLFSKGLIPFSVLLTSSIVQDGHGLLPMFSYSVKDALKIKMFNFAFGLIIGLIFFSFGI
jgi:hypothetical protein